MVDRGCHAGIDMFSIHEISVQCVKDNSESRIGQVDRMLQETLNKAA